MTRRAKEEEKPVSLSDMLDDLSQQLHRVAEQPNMLMYSPHLKQKVFHESTAYGRWFLGGNRSGKSVAGVLEDLYWVTKRHPYFKIPSHTQIRGRVVGSDFTNGIETILFPIFKQWILPSDLINGSWEDSYDKQDKTLTLQDGSFIEFRSCDQELVKHAGTSRHFVHFDEEPPFKFFEENLMRLIDTGFGRWWITMTPVEGMTWMHDQMYEPEEEIPEDLLKIIEVEQAENPYLKEEERQKALSFLSREGRQAREKGTFVSRGGRVLKRFSPDVHCKKMPGWRPPRNWTVYTSQDHGYRNPTAVGWHAVRPDGREVVTFHEIYVKETLVKDIAAAMLEFEQTLDNPIYMRTGDPNMKQRSGITGTSILHEYAQHGIILGVEGIPKDENIGIDRMNEYLEIDPVTMRPYWTLTQDCKWHIREFKKLSWRTYASAKLDDKNNPVEKVHDKDNHAFDEAKYFFTFMRDLGQEETKPEFRDDGPGSWTRGLQVARTTPSDAYNPIKWDVQEAFVLEQSTDSSNDYGWSYGD